MNIQWFPGHMTKAIRMMEENLRLVDAVIYVIDARAVKACNNPLFDKLIYGKKVLYVFNKCDLVEPSDLKLWCDEFTRYGKPYVKAVGTSGDCSEIVRGLKNVTSEKIEKFSARGANASVRAMVVGVPNSGKSTIINSMCKRAKAVTGDRPGVTKGKQWLSVDGIDFLDTPGTLWSKFDDQTTALHLAFIGSIREEVLDVNELAIELLKTLKENHFKNICIRYGLNNRIETGEIDTMQNGNNPVAEDDAVFKLFEDIALSRGYKSKGGEPDFDRTSKMLIDEFRKGKLGKIMLEKPETEGLRLKSDK